MDYDRREQRRYALQRIVWDVVFVLLCGYFSFNLIANFISADRSAGWTSQSYVSLIGTVIFLAIAALLIFGIVKKIKRYKEEFGE